MQFIGQRIFPAATPVDREIIEALRPIATPHLSDNLSRSVGIVGLTRYSRRGKLLGTAFTVKTRPGDNVYIYKALTMLQPGHVLVVDLGGDTNNAVIGELMKLYAEQRGCAGFVVNGAIRDVATFEKGEFPCYARGNTHRGPYKSGPGEINVPVAVGGQVIEPGDVLVGDEDGIVSFPRDIAGELIAKARETAACEDAIKAEIATGNPEQSWIAKALAHSCIDS
ncbi:RraA family protein [Telmatospirillum siberiense]|uniref:Putative 4-hydroxy-4-methyl-2-oxoglutarate aldolase n=1 Tax=Telmatospirillum siberiense TaxID=382514 RepID=A0A2N3PYL1_9PROT|nr:RraA family protein [Telmatospirillum siberiense]PKU25506.1 methyltransferase [Telmatospirillum siberiense]